MNVYWKVVDCAVNLGALVLHALFEHWPSTHPQPPEVKQVEKGLSIDLEAVRTILYTVTVADT